MLVTAQQRHQLFLWFEAQMGQEQAATMMELMPPVGAEQLATKAGLNLLRAGLKADMAEIRADLIRSLGTLLIASRAAVIVAIGVFTAIS